MEWTYPFAYVEDAGLVAFAVLERPRLIDTDFAFDVLDDHLGVFRHAKETAVYHVAVIGL